MTKKDVLNIVEYIATDSFFKDFVVRKRDNSILLKTDYGYKQVQLVHYNSYDLSRNDLALEITPGYAVRFNVLHKWFEKYCKRPLNVQREDYSVGLIGSMFNKTSEFYLLESREDYTKDVQKIYTEVVNNAKCLFSKFATLNGIYQYHIGEVLQGKEELPDGGAGWVFQYLILTRLVAPSSYDIVKNMILERVKLMISRKEPNIIMYSDDLPAILDDLEHTDFSTGEWGKVIL